MTPEQLQEFIKANEVATDKAIQKYVNGKIDRMNTKLDEYIVADTSWKTTVDRYMTEMMPVKDGVQMFQTMNKFIKWLGFPAIGALIAYWFIK